jgi:hypothetical protein
MIGTRDGQKAIAGTTLSARVSGHHASQALRRSSILLTGNKKVSCKLCGVNPWKFFYLPGNYFFEDLAELQICCLRKAVFR